MQPKSLLASIPLHPLHVLSAACESPLRCLVTAGLQGKLTYSCQSASNTEISTFLAYKYVGQSLFLK